MSNILQGWKSLDGLMDSPYSLRVSYNPHGDSSESTTLRTVLVVADGDQILTMR